MSIRRQVMIAVAVALVLASCGGDAPGGRRDGDAPPAGVTTDARPEPAPLPVSSCEAQGHVALADEAPIAPTRRRIDAAAANARRTGHRFVTALQVRASGLRADGVLTGRRLADNTSAATLRWRGAAALLLPDLQLRIVGDRIHAHREGRRDWQLLGSASGVSLDVGRELLDHPSLLVARAARAGGPHAAVDLVAPARPLRTYATTERRGPVTDLLAGTRSLTLSASATGRRLTSDEFRLATRLPRSIDVPGLQPGTVITVTSLTSYCPLRSRDRRTISAPPVHR